MKVINNLVIFCGQKPVALSIPIFFLPVNNLKIKSEVKSKLQVGLLCGLEVEQKRITTCDANMQVAGIRPKMLPTGQL